MQSFGASSIRRPLSRAQTAIGNMQVVPMDQQLHSQHHHPQQSFGMQMGHRHSMSMPGLPGQPHLPQQPSNLSLQTSVSHDMADLDDSGIGMSLMDDDALSKFGFTATDIGSQLMSHGEIGVSMV